MTIWQFIGMIFQQIFDALESFTLFYGVTGYQLVLLFVVLVDLAAIIRAIFGGKVDE